MEGGGSKFRHVGSNPSMSPTGSYRYRPRNLGKVNLEKVERFRKRDLFASHGKRMNKNRDDIDQEVGQNLYRPRSTPIIKAKDYPKFVTSRGGVDPHAFGKALRREIEMGDSKEAVDGVWLQNRQREASQRRLHRHTQRLVGQWSRQLARFEEESQLRQETAWSMMPHLRNIKGVSSRLAATPNKKQFWVQDGWTEEIQHGEESDDDDDDSVSAQMRTIPRISAKERNADRSFGSAGRHRDIKGKHYAETRWKLPNDIPRGSPYAAPGMEQLSLENKRASRNADANNSGYMMNESSKYNNNDSSRVVKTKATSPIQAAMTFEQKSRGRAFDALNFSPFKPYSMYQSQAHRPHESNEMQHNAASDAAASRLQFERIKMKLAKHGIHIKRGNLERALLAPQAEENDDKQKTLPKLLYELPTKPPGKDAEKKKKSKKKGKKKKKKKK